MERTALRFLAEWLTSSIRKPLVIRGARQVGKTWLVRHLAEANKRKLIEVNFEKRPELISLFASNDPQRILINLSAIAGQIDPKRCLLFLDEIQSAPELFAKLRWFAEDMPELPVIAAGSLLEFVLAKHNFSMPVGRINYLHLEPLSFEEFLLARGKKELAHYMQQYQLDETVPEAVHAELMLLSKEYVIVGGMPQAVASWVYKRSLPLINQIHYDLIATYRDDFARYHGRLPIERLEETLVAVPRFLGEKFVYSKVNPTSQSTSIKQSLDLLCKARVCHKVMGTAANGVPLGAEIQDKYMKAIFLDVGLCSALLGLSLNELITAPDLELVNKGGIAEQLVGQALRIIEPWYKEPALYYWHREGKTANAEIDYVIQQGTHVVPVEVKAGSTGGLKSLHLFMELKGLSLAVRINADMPSVTQVNVKGQSKTVTYTLMSLPYYLLGELPRLLVRAAK